MPPPSSQCGRHKSIAPVGGVELLAEGDHVVVGPDPLAAGEPLQRRHPAVHLVDLSDEERFVAGQSADGVDNVRGDEVGEEAVDAILQLAVVEVATWRPEIVLFLVVLFDQQINTQWCYSHEYIFKGILVEAGGPVIPGHFSPRYGVVRA